MPPLTRRSLTLLAALAAWPALGAPPLPGKGAAPAPAAKAAPAKAPAPARASPNAPMPAGPAVKWVHSPYEAGDCAVCHERNDPKSPGKVAGSINELCGSCHGEMAEILARPHRHAAVEDCTACHNPHNGPARKLLLADLPDLCWGCHPAMQEKVAAAKVKHDALTTGQKCVGCHDPHASQVQKLLVALPYDLCVDCHAQDGVKASDGRLMGNVKQVLADNPVWHDPVKAKDCSACHLTHGGPNFSLLLEPYPANFYAPYATKDYALCFGCHEEKAISTPETATLTSFRDGTRNLHALHVKQKRGRTCRACHEVHASKQEHQIRDSVPFGPRNWMLKVGYTRLPTGGTCARTCHEAKTYHYNRTVKAVAP